LRACVRANGGHFELPSDCQFVFSVLDELDTMLDAVGNILRVRYKNMKCDVSFSQGNVITLFR